MNFLVKHILRLRNTLRRNLTMLGLKLQYGSRLQAKKFHFRNNFSLIIEGEGKISIGRNVFFNNGCSLTSMQNIQIGDNCVFGENVHIYDHNHEYRDRDVIISKQGFSSDDVVIEEDCWLGTNVTILKGVHIGKHSVVGAGVVVYKDLPAYSVTICKQDLLTTIIEKKEI